MPSRLNYVTVQLSLVTDTVLNTSPELFYLLWFFFELEFLA